MSATGLIFALLFVLGCVLAIVRRPIYGLMTYVMFFYLHPPSRWWGQGILADVRWSFIAAFVTLLAILLRRSTGTEKGTKGGEMFVGMWLFIGWLAVQFAWAMDSGYQMEFLDHYVKFLMAVFLIYRCVDSEENLRLFLWVHVLGCGYFGLLAFNQYSGGRFEGFGGAGLGEANAGALQVATGIFAAASLFLYEKGRWRLALLAVIPFILNASVATVSRSGFLALTAGAIAYALFSPKRLRKIVILMSIPAVMLFVMLTNPNYWNRMETIKYRGEAVENVDTGGGRVELMKAQWEMFKRHPLGCGHRCTAFLSVDYLDDHLLTGQGEGRGRSSHNTFLTLLVEQGVPGAILYSALLYWVIRNLFRLKALQGASSSLVAATIPAVGAASVAMFVGDMFVSYVRLEVRFWFVAMLLVLLRLSTSLPNCRRSGAPAAGRTV